MTTSTYLLYLAIACAGIIGALVPIVFNVREMKAKQQLALKDTGDLQMTVDQLMRACQSPQSDPKAKLADSLGVRLELDDKKVRLLRNLPIERIVEIAGSVAEDDVVSAHEAQKNEDPAAVGASRITNE